MKTALQLAQWCTGAAFEFGDPSVPVCQMFVRWQPNARPASTSADELCCAVNNGQLVLLLGPQTGEVPIEIEHDGPRQNEDGFLVAFGAELITPGVWALTPSLNIPGVLHGFVVLHGVPSPAPWEQTIAVPSSRLVLP